MLPDLSKIKGIHPGAILKRELKLQNLKSSDLADRIDEHKQTISAILNKRRGVNPKLSVKLAKQFTVDDDYFMLLQSSYDVKMVVNSHFSATPNMNNFREVIFWDTTLDKIDWLKNKRAIIQRVLERGNDIEINEIISFYGKAAIVDEIQSIKSSRFASFKENIKRFNLV